jgi:hypothetical protein
MDQRLALITAESDRVYAELSAKLASLGAGSAVSQRSGWTASQVYGHLARWLERSQESLERHLRGEAPVHEHEDEDSLNVRWAAEDEALSEIDAQVWCEEARGRLLATLSFIPAESWDRTVELLARDDTIVHARAHLASLVARGA